MNMQQGKQDWTRSGHGGRLTKFKGVVASLAPDFAGLVPCSASSLFPVLLVSGGLLTATVSPSALLAGSCSLSNGTYTCSGAADPANDVPQTINNTSVSTVTTTPGFGISTSRGVAISLRNSIGGDLVFTDTNASLIESRGNYAGLYASQSAGGSVAITTNGEVNSEGWVAIFVENRGGTNLTVSANDVTAEQAGVVAIHSGTGETTITVSGDITVGVDGNARASFGEGVYARSTGVTSKDLTISVANVTATGNAVEALSRGVRELRITATGSLVGGTPDLAGDRAGYGVVAETGENNQSMVIQVADVSGTRAGIDAEHRGRNGSLIITSTGHVKGGVASDATTRAYRGIDATSYNGSSLTISVNDVTSYNDDAVGASNLGIGTSSFSSVGTLIAGTPEDAPGSTFADGVVLFSGENTSDMKILVNKVRANDDGVVALHNGRGALTITATGDVVGGFSGTDVVQSDAAFVELYEAGHGILAKVGSSDLAEKAAIGDVDINAVNVSGSGDGIRVENQGAGAVNITATGEVTGGTAGTHAVFAQYQDESGSGIAVGNSGLGQAVTITAAQTSGAYHGIAVDHQGSGAVTITATGAVTGGNGTYDPGTGNGVSGVGIGVLTSDSGGDVSITATDVSGQGDGVFALVNGAGALTINTSGTVQGGLRGSVPVSIDDDSLQSYGNGITGTVRGGGNTLEIRATGAVTGQNAGIYATNTGTGPTTVSSEAAVTGREAGGILVLANNDQAVTVSASDSTGGEAGIGVLQEGSGRVTVTSSGRAQGSDAGIGVAATGGAISITSALASGDAIAGILALQNETGEISVTTSGRTASTNGTGIQAQALAGGAITVAAAQVAGGNHGIDARSEGIGGDIAITASHSVTGQTGKGIHAETATNATVDISGAVSGDTVAVDLSGVAGRADLVLRGQTAALRGQALTRTDDSDDRLILTGESAGALDLAVFGDTANANAIIGFENLEVSGSGIWGLSGIQSSGAFASASVADGAALRITSGTLLLGSGVSLDVDANARLLANGTAVLAGGLRAPGTVSLQDGAVDDSLTVQGDFAGGGTLELDVDFANRSADQLVIQGDITGTTTLAVNTINQGAIRVGDTAAVVRYTGESSASDFVLGGTDLSSGLFDISLQQEPENSQWSLSVGGLGASGVSYQGFVPGILSSAESITELLANLSRPGGPTARPGVTVSSRGDAKADTPFWMHLFGATADGRDVGTPGLTYSYETTSYGFQAGADLWSIPSAGGDWVISVFGEVKNTASNSSNSAGSGSVDSRGAGLGMSAVWTASQGHYFGVIGQVATSKSDVESSTGGRLVSGHDATNVVLAVTGGYEIPISARTRLTPNASLTWTEVDGGSFADGAGNTVDFGVNDALVLKLGADYEIDAANGGKFWLSGHVSRDISDVNTVTLGTLPVEAGFNETLLEIGIGGHIPVSDTARLYGEAIVGRSLGSSSSDTRDTLAATFGVQFNF